MTDDPAENRHEIDFYAADGTPLPSAEGAATCEITEYDEHGDLRRTYASLNASTEFGVQWDEGVAESADWPKRTWDLFTDDQRLIERQRDLFDFLGVTGLPPSEQYSELVALLDLPVWNAAPPRLKSEVYAWLDSNQPGELRDEHRTGDARERSDTTMTDDDIELDSQGVEILGRNALVNSLLRAGIEVARPERDRGIDLLAYRDQDIESGRFAAAPIQMKASRGATFSLSAKYERFPDLLMAYVWNVGEPNDTVVYAMTYGTAHEIAEDAGWLATDSWTVKGHYVTTRPSTALTKALERHLATPGRWQDLLAGGRHPGARSLVGQFDLGQVVEVDGERLVITGVFVDGAMAIPEGAT